MSFFGRKDRGTPAQDETAARTADDTRTGAADESAALDRRTGRAPEPESALRASEVPAGGTGDTGAGAQAAPAGAAGDGVAPERTAAASSSGPETALASRIADELRTIYDPEIPVNIYEMGLIYGIDIDDEARVTIRMTLTSPACPVAQSLPLEVEQKVSGVEGVRSARVEIVWDPPWTPDRMSEDAKLELGWF